MRHLGIQRDPAEPPPGDRVADLGAQALLAQPVPELQEHQPQVAFDRLAFDRRGRPPEYGVEVRRERREERRVIQERIHPRQLLRQPQQLRRQQRLPRRHRTAYSAKHDGLDHF